MKKFLTRLALCMLAAIGLPLAAWPASAGTVLSSNADFKLLSWLGFREAIDGAHPEGKAANIYAWSMSWFKGKLYVGTLAVPETGQIWQYTPGGADGASGTWKMVYESPQGLVGPREAGYRWMTVCQFGNTEYMFVSTLGPLQGNILRTTDGVNFTPMSRTGMPFPAVGFRTMVCFRDPSGKQLLVTTPVGKFGTQETLDSDSSDNPIVLVNDDPGGNGSWRNYSLMAMGEPDNDVLFTLYTVNNTLYAGTNNKVTGAQVWKTTGSCTRPNCVPTWTKVLDRGGGRSLNSDGTPKNVGVSDMMAYGGHLYIGIAVPDSPKPPAEMLRLRLADDTVQVVFGEPRLNFGTGTVPTNPNYPQNLRCGVPLENIDGAGGTNDCPPTSRRGAGFGPISDAAGGYPPGVQSYFWRLLHYVYDPVKAPLGDNRLYTGTLGTGGSQGNGIEPGFDIMATTDGLDWKVITNDGLGDPRQRGMRAIASSPIGLFIGSATRSTSSTPSEGMATWIGIPQPDSVPPVTTLGPPSPAEGATVNSHNVDFAWSGTDAPAPGSLPLSYAYRLDPLEPSFSVFGSATGKSYVGLLNGTYTFHVIAKDAAGNTESPGSAPGAGNRRTFTVSAPDAPPTVTIQLAPASPNASGNVAFSWTGTDDLTPTAGLVYDYWLSPLQSDPNTFAATTSATYSGLTDGSYVFHVKARDGAGNVGSEATAAFTVALPAGAPLAPTPATATALGAGIVRIAWSDVASETSYNVERCVAGPRCGFYAAGSNLAANTSSFDDAPGGFPGTQYIYRVRACNAAGCSAWAVTNTVTLQ